MRTFFKKQNQESNQKVFIQSFHTEKNLNRIFWTSHIFTRWYLSGLVFFQILISVKREFTPHYSRSLEGATLPLLLQGRRRSRQLLIFFLLHIAERTAQLASGSPRFTTGHGGVEQAHRDAGGKTVTGDGGQYEPEVKPRGAQQVAEESREDSVHTDTEPDKLSAQHARSEAQTQQAKGRLEEHGQQAIRCVKL